MKPRLLGMRDAEKAHYPSGSKDPNARVLGPKYH